MNKHLSLSLCALVFALLVGCAGAPARLGGPELVPPSAGTLRAPPAAKHPRIAFVLGGGSARGFAHIGVLKTLEDNGIHADIIVGTSAGSLVGALYAGGIRGEALVNSARALERAELTDWVFPDRGFINGLLLQQAVNKQLNHRNIEELDIPYAAVATELQSGHLSAFTHGNTGMAVRASCGIPGVVKPLMIGGIEYVDGGLVSPLPVNVAHQLGADFIIAVDVSQRPYDIQEITSTIDVLNQAINIMTQRLIETETRHVDILIRPQLKALQSTDFAGRDFAIAAGAQAALEALPLIRARLAGKQATR